MRTEYDVVCAEFQDLRGDFKSFHRIKYNLYIKGIESGIKNDPQSFFKFAIMKRNSFGYPSSMFFESQSARGPEEAVDLFAEFLQEVNVSEDEPVSFPTLDSLSDEKHESHKVSLDEQKGPGPDGILPSKLRKLVSVVKVSLTCSVQSVLIDWHFSY
jgi:hypothetical protein